MKQVILYEKGDMLPSGATVIEHILEEGSEGSGYVLATTNNPAIEIGGRVEYVTWATNPNGMTFHGNYWLARADTEGQLRARTRLRDRVRGIEGE